MLQRNGRFRSVVLGVVLALALTVSGSAQSPAVLNLGTHALGTLVNALGTGIGAVLNSHLDVEVKVVPTSGPAEWLPQIHMGEFHLGIFNNYDALHGRNATGGFERALGGRKTPIMLLTSGTPNLNAPITSLETGVSSCADYKGMRVIDRYTASAGVDAQAKGAIANCGLKSGDYRSVAVPGPAPGVTAIIENRADIGTSAAIGMGVVTELDAKSGARFISLDPDRWEEYTKHYPARLVLVEPAPDLIGVVEPTWMAEYPFYLVGAESLSEDLVYEVVKTLWEKNDELAAMHPGLRQWSTDRFVDDTATIPYHPGAVRFYKDIGVWSDEMEAIQQNLLSQ